MACSRCGSQCVCACSGAPLPSLDWRRQVSLTVRAHKARKRRRLDPDSPFLEFEEKDLQAIQEDSSRPEESGWAQEAVSTLEDSWPTSNIVSSSHATEQESAASEMEQDRVEDLYNPSSAEPVIRPPLPPFPRITTPAPKIIEFPRIQPRQYELAEPVADQLRIFEAIEEPRTAITLTHLSAIEIAPEEPVHVDSKIEVPIQPAALQNRFYAAALDLIIMIGAGALFVMCAQLFMSGFPQTKPLLANAVICGLLLITIYYSLSFSLRRSTAGIDAAGLSVVCFSGEPPSRFLLRCRAMATVLSYAALGMGLIWSLIDEDRLCWHDRITHTYLTSKY